MSALLTLGMPYYKNPAMLAEHYRVWAEYPEALKADVRIVLVDDGSPQPALDVPRPDGLPDYRIYRVLVDKPWHQHGARNLAATVAETPWLLLTDMDHVVPAHTMTALLALLARADRQTVYTFARVDAPHGRPTLNDHGEKKPHVNTFAIAKAHYWHIGGYDEDCLGYGTDGYFRARMKAASRMKHLEDLEIIRYPREVISDASSFQEGLDPRAFRNAGRRTEETRRRMERKAALKLGPTTLAFPWERVL